jgi:hypothetical protein
VINHHDAQFVAEVEELATQIAAAVQVAVPAAVRSNVPDVASRAKEVPVR